MLFSIELREDAAVLLDGAEMRPCGITARKFLDCPLSRPFVDGRTKTISSRAIPSIVDIDGQFLRINCLTPTNNEDRVGELRLKTSRNNARKGFLFGKNFHALAVVCLVERTTHLVRRRQIAVGMDIHRELVVWIRIVPLLPRIACLLEEMRELLP